VRELGAQITEDYADRDLLLIALLKASFVFLADLSRAIPITGLDVLLIEDVVDTGLTLNYLCKLLSLRKPASLRVATLLDRPYRRLVNDLPVDYVGFTVPDEFFVGYGFDIDERWRNLPDLRLASLDP
jgi:hypoxanthine phosphoribosyltransferase